MVENSPIPPIVQDWEINATVQAKKWSDRISKQLINKWSDMWDQHVNGMEIVSFDLTMDL